MIGCRTRTSRMGFGGRWSGLESDRFPRSSRRSSEGDQICAEIAISGQIVLLTKPMSCAQSEHRIL